MKTEAYTKFQCCTTHHFPYFVFGEYVMIHFVLTNEECKRAHSLFTVGAITQAVSYVLPGIAGFVVGKIGDKLMSYADGVMHANRGGGAEAFIGVPTPGFAAGLDTFSVKTLPVPRGMYAGGPGSDSDTRPGPGGIIR